jgi:hypothetical protein
MRLRHVHSHSDKHTRCQDMNQDQLINDRANKVGKALIAAIAGNNFITSVFPLEKVVIQVQLFVPRSRLSFFFLSFSLLLCSSRDITSQAPTRPTMVLVRHFIHGHHHLCSPTLSTLSPLIRLYLIKPLGLASNSYWNKLDAIYCAAATSPW